MQFIFRKVSSTTPTTISAERAHFVLNVPVKICTDICNSTEQKIVALHRNTLLAVELPVINDNVVYFVGAVPEDLLPTPAPTEP